MGVTTSPPEGATLTLTVDSETSTTLTSNHCTEENISQSVKFTLTTDSMTPPLVEDDKLYIWWETSDSDDCTTPSSDANNQVITGATLSGDSISQDSGVPLVTTSVGLVIPDDIESLSLTNQDIFNRMDTDACTTEVDYTELKLCIAIDTVSATVDDNVTISSSSEAWTAITFVVDTAAPSAPEIGTVTSLDGSIDIPVSVSDETPRISTWKLYIQQESDTSDADCTLWDVTPVEYALSTKDNTTDTLNYRADNGVAYEFCVIAVDEAGNESAASDIKVAQSQDECDFIECYPGDLKDGYCTAAPPGLWWLAGLGILWRRRRGGLKS